MLAFAMRVSIALCFFLATAAPAGAQQVLPPALVSQFEVTPQ